MLAEFGRFLQQQAVRDSDDDAEQDNRRVEQLVSRAAEAVLLPDRRAALQELRDVLVGNPRAQMAFGACGFPLALGVVRDREDLESVQLALESLAAAVGGGADAGSQVQAGAVLACWRACCCNTSVHKLLSCAGYFSLPYANARRLVSTPTTQPLPHPRRRRSTRSSWRAPRTACRCCSACWSRSRLAWQTFMRDTTPCKC